MNPRILLVEDNPGDARLVRELIAETPGPALEIVTADALGTALAHLRARRFDVVLLDLGLPESEGLATLQTVRAQAPGAAVIVLTGRDDEELGAGAVRLGADDYLVKGHTDGRGLRRAVRHAIERTAANREIEHERRITRALAAGARTLAASPKVVEVARDIVEAAYALFQAEYTAVAQVDEPTGDLVVVALCGAPGTTVAPEFVLPRDEGAMGLAVRQRGPVSTTDFLADPHIRISPEVRQRFAGAPYRAVLAVPLIANDRIVGAFSICDRTSREFTPEEIALARAFADQAAVGFEVARLFEASERRRNEAVALAELSRSLSEDLDPDRAGQRVVDGVRRLLAVRSAVLYQITADGGLVAVKKSNGAIGAPPNTPVLEPGHGLCGLALAARTTRWTADLLADADVRYTDDARRGLETVDHRALLAIPLSRGDADFGVLAISDTTGRAFTADEIRLAEALAAHAAIALDNARLHAAAVRSSDERAALLGAAKTVMSGLDLSTTLDRIVDEAARISGTPHVKILLVDDDRPVLRVAAARGRPIPEDLEIRVGKSFSGWVAETGRLLFVTNVAADPRNLLPERDRADGIVTYLGLPVQWAGETFGVLTFNTTAPRCYATDELDLLSSFANQAALAIHNARLFAREQAARQAAEQSEARYRELFDDVPVGLFRTTPGGRFLAVNSALVTICRYPDAAALQATDVHDLYVDVADRERWRSMLDARDTVTGFELPFRRYDGTTGWGRTTARAIRDADGAVTAYEGAFEDVTGQRQQAAELEWTAAQFHAAVEHLPFDFWVCDADGRFLFQNASSVRCWGDLRNVRVEDTALPADLVQRAVVTRDRALAGENIREEMEYVVDGGARSIDRLISPIVVSGRIVGAVGVSIDTTERKLTQRALQDSEAQVRQLQKMEALGRLAAGVAHDFNNLLTVIAGRAELLLMRRDLRDAKIQTNLGLIRETTKRATELTRQLLAFSRKQILQPQVLEMNQVVAGTEKILRRVLGEDIELAIALDPAAGCVNADPTQLEQVLLNLVVNARDAMPTGGRLHIRTAGVRLDEAITRHGFSGAPGPYTVLEVVDSGCGMDVPTRERIFEPFFTTKGQHGTGLGLSTVFGVVRQSGGDVRVSSEPGLGSTFTVLLPRIEMPAGTDGPTAVAPRRRTGTETILLVEDEPEVRAVGAEILADAGYTVLLAADGLEALEVAAGQRVDLLLTDVIMPRMSGGELAAEFRRRHPATRLLFASGFTDDVLGRHGLLTAVTGLLHKPYSVDDLLRTVRETLDAADAVPPTGVRA